MTRLTILALSLIVAGALYAQTPNNIEAAEYDPTANRWFISNGSSILETSDGGASYAYFGSGSATHGMEVIDGHLFAIGNNVVRAYDLATADLVGSLSIPGAAFLNGMGSRSGVNGLVNAIFDHRVGSPTSPEVARVGATFGQRNLHRTAKAIWSSSIV